MSENGPIRVVLADDHEIVRRGLRALIDAQSDLAVVGAAICGPDALPIVTRECPHVLILDLMLPGLNGLDLLPRLVEAEPDTRVVVFTTHAAESYVAAALRAGALAYVIKEADSDELLHAIREANEGRGFLSPSLSREKVNQYLRQGADADPLKSDIARARGFRDAHSQGVQCNDCVTTAPEQPYGRETPSGGDAQTWVRDSCSGSPIRLRSRIARLWAIPSFRVDSEQNGYRYPYRKSLVVPYLAGSTSA